jgi:hypothetical protein
MEEDMVLEGKPEMAGSGAANTAVAALSDFDSQIVKTLRRLK